MTGTGTAPRRERRKRVDEQAPGANPRAAPPSIDHRRASRSARIDPGRSFAVLRAAQQALLLARDEAELLGRICEIAVDHGGYRFAWVGFARNDADRTVRPVARAGVDEGYLNSISVTWSDTPLGRGPVGMAIRAGRAVGGLDVLTAPNFAPWRDEALKRGFASVLVLPLREEGRPFGVLAIYDGQPDAFSQWDVELLTGLADALAFGITTLRARLASESDLRRSQGNLADAQRISHIGSWDRDLSTGTVVRSAEAHRIFGVEPGVLPPTVDAFFDLVHPDDRVAVQAAKDDALAGGVDRYDCEFRIIRPDGSVRTAHEIAEILRAPDGTPLHVVGTIEDITDRVAADTERAHLVAAVEQTADAVWLKDVDSIVTYVNRSFTRVYGYSSDEIVGQFAGLLDSGRHDHAFFDAIWESVSGGESWTGLLVNRGKDGRNIEVEAVISAIRDASDQLIGFMQTDRDVTHERALENALERRAREREMIEGALARIDARATPEEISAAACVEILALPIVDSAFVLALDPDSQGIVLAVEGRVATAFRMSQLIPAARTKYLFERASAGAWIEPWNPRAEDGAYGEQISATGMHTIAYAPLRAPGDDVIGVVGVAIHDRARDLFAEQLPILKTLASILGNLLWPGLEARSREDGARAGIQRLLDAAAFRPFFQPIIEFHTGMAVGYEALTRFTGGLPPDVTFGLAARSGLGLELETATLRAALAAAPILTPAAYLSLNASPQMIISGRLGAILGTETRSIVLEITEHVVIEDYPSLVREIAKLPSTIRIAVDDAGAGYASLRHVLELAPSFVKLDIGLIRGINADPARQALVAGMGYFALKRKIRLIAEGIETVAELTTLRELGVAYGQGYLLGRPQDAGGPGPWPGKIVLPTA